MILITLTFLNLIKKLFFNDFDRENVAATEKESPAEEKKTSTEAQPVVPQHNGDQVRVCFHARKMKILIAKKLDSL
jgi:hypothetical protein